MNPDTLTATAADLFPAVNAKRTRTAAENLVVAAIEIRNMQGRNADAARARVAADIDPAGMPGPSFALANLEAYVGYRTVWADLSNVIDYIVREGLTVDQAAEEITHATLRAITYRADGFVTAARVETASRLGLLR